VRILFITTDENKNLQYPDRSQGDCHENVALLGLRKLLGKNCVDYPRKRILYHDWSDVKRSSLHGRGFSIYHEPMQDIPEECRDLDSQTFDVILYGTAFNWGMGDIPELEEKCKAKFYIDGNDLIGNAPNNQYVFYNGQKLIGNQISPAFKTQLIEVGDDLYPFGVAVPESRVLDINIKRKHKLFQKSYPREAMFESKEINRSHYCFTDEEDYYNDMADSWFGLSCTRGGWDAIRNYEIIAAGSVVLFRNYNQKPPFCSPVNLPTLSYSSMEDLDKITSTLVRNGKPTYEYMELLKMQRKWLLDTATTLARGRQIVGVLNKYVKD
jgi:hypothetical protein